MLIKMSAVLAYYFFLQVYNETVNVRGIRTGKIRRNSDFPVSLELKYGIGNDQE